MTALEFTLQCCFDTFIMEKIYRVHVDDLEQYVIAEHTSVTKLEINRYALAVDKEDINFLIETFQGICPRKKKLPNVANRAIRYSIDELRDRIDVLRSSPYPVEREFGNKVYQATYGVNNEFFSRLVGRSLR